MRAAGQAAGSTPRPRVLWVAAGVWLRADAVFVARRRDVAPGAPAWEFPGGKREPGETLAQTLAREWEEEFGLRPRVGRHLVTVAHPLGPTRLLRLSVWRVYSAAPTPVPREHAEVAWVPVTALAGVDLLPADRPVAEWLHRHAPRRPRA